jgi:hypothetical protein
VFLAAVFTNSNLTSQNEIETDFNTWCVSLDGSPDGAFQRGNCAIPVFSE